MEISLKDFHSKIKSSKKPVLVEFWASWCLPCQSAGVFLDELEKEYENKVVILKVNVDKNPLASDKYNILGVPTFITFKEGLEVSRKVGSQTKKSINQMILDLT